jgi:mRNA-degrading endonuclease RelE of RelBE toxin-antitoxin system
MEFIATPTFNRKRKKLMSDADFERFEQDLAEAPEVGAVIAGTGGLRKIRYALPGRGKSGGVRIIYFWITSRDRIILLDIYAKSSKADLSGADEKKLAKIRDEVIENLDEH